MIYSEPSKLDLLRDALEEGIERALSQNKIPVVRQFQKGKLRDLYGIDLDITPQSMIDSVTRRSQLTILLNQRLTLPHWRQLKKWSDNPAGAAQCIENLREQFRGK